MQDCPVCYEEKRVFKVCSNDHGVCHACIKKMVVQPQYDSDELCKFECPICREENQCQPLINTERKRGFVDFIFMQHRKMKKFALRVKVQSDNEMTKYEKNYYIDYAIFSITTSISANLMGIYDIQQIVKQDVYDAVKFYLIPMPVPYRGMIRKYEVLYWYDGTMIQIKFKKQQYNQLMVIEASALDSDSEYQVESAEPSQ